MRGSLVAVAAAALLAPPLAAQKPVITRADQLPVHSYAVSEVASKVLQDSAAVDRLAAEVQRDIKHDLAHYDIQDRTTRRDDYQALSQIALMQGRYGEAFAYADSTRAFQTKPAERLLTGVMLRAQIEAAKAPPKEAQRAFGLTLQRALESLPFDTIQAMLKSNAAGLATLSPGLLIGLVEGAYDPASKSGRISMDIALNLVSMATILRAVLPYREVALAVMNHVIDTHPMPKTDIWPARDVSLDSVQGLTPVIVAINDVGTDVSLFPGRVWTNPGEIPGNGKDDDHDGYVDDVHGIGWTWDGREVPGVLRPIAPYTRADLDSAAADIEGFDDLQAHVNTPAARAVQAKIARLPAAQAKPFIERLEFYTNYAHGTHVAGIAARGNPAIRLQVDRIEFPYRLIPPAPTQEWADSLASALQRTVSYYQRTGVRVVNMSWGLSQDDLQRMLEENRVGKSASERKAMAAQYFSTLYEAFREAIADAPSVLFVSAAGNSDNSNTFTQTIPASFNLPNTITVGAVDQAGDQAGFTSFGKVDVYADGYEVESVLPGGRKQKWSGTSMAAPQVVNLAAKLLAVYPKLGPIQVKTLIVMGADARLVGGQTIQLLNEKQTFALAAKQLH